MRRHAIARAALSLVMAALVAAAAGCGGSGGSGKASADRPDRIHDLYVRLSPGVLFVQAQIVRRGDSPFVPILPRRGVATGTGFVYDHDGHIVTNAHVVEHATSVSLREGNELIAADVVGSDLSTDLAVLKVDPGDLTLHPLQLGDSKDVHVGDEVAALGNPFGLEDTITTGIVSARQRRITAPNGYAIEGAIQTDAAVNPGNSGGPLVDLQGRVIGVNSQIATAGTSRSSAGVAFAIPASTVEDIVPDLIDDGRVRRPFLGVSTVDVTDSVSRHLGLSVKSGALVVAVASGSPAQRAGLHAARTPGGALVAGGDVIVGIDGRRVKSAKDVSDAVLSASAGESIDIEIVRGGRHMHLQAELSRRPSAG